MPLILSLEGRPAVVTGGASGIGLATAELLAKADAPVTILDISEHGPDIAAGIGAGYVHCDMSDMEQIDSAYRQITQDMRGPPSILVNNVGVAAEANVLSMGANDTFLWNVNVLGPLHLTRLVMGGIKASGAPKDSCITFVGSTQAEVVDGMPTIYNAHKAAIEGLVRVLAVEGGPHGIRVNCVAPGPIATEGMGAATPDNMARIRATTDRIPLGRRGRAEEVAWDIVSLCFATYAEGDVRTVDGGFRIVAMADPNRHKPEYVPGDPDRD